MDNIIKYLEEFKEIKFHNEDNEKSIFTRYDDDLNCLIDKIEKEVFRLWKINNDRNFLKTLSLFEDGFIYKCRRDKLSEEDIDILIQAIKLNNHREMFELLYNNDIETFPEIDSEREYE